MHKSIFALALLALLFAVLPAQARQHCIVTTRGAVVCPYTPDSYNDPNRRPGYPNGQQNPYRYGSKSRPYNQPVH